MILYRPMVSGDVAAGLSLSRAAGWNQTREDWELFLSVSPHGCFVAVDDEGNVRGTVASVRYQDHFSWVGMVLVEPAWQRRGIGIQLLREALRFLSNEDTVKLDASPAGRHIYVQLDFVDEYPLSRMETRQVSENLLVESKATRIFPDRMPSVLGVDRRVFGARREAILGSALNRSPQLAWLLQDGEGIKGYCFGRLGCSFAHIGPVIAEDFETARSLVSAALRNTAGRPVIIDALSHTTEWIQWLTSLGFREQRSFIRMHRGTNRHPGIPGKQFAIFGPEFG